MGFEQAATGFENCFLVTGWGHNSITKQESSAIAKMTVQCAIYMSATKVFQCAHKI